MTNLEIIALITLTAIVIIAAIVMDSNNREIKKYEKFIEDTKKELKNTGEIK
tara:strand:+ start:482 stop:637 length:156 start_codon:yes stop_codon:yes gene_type:complete